MDFTSRLRRRERRKPAGGHQERNRLRREQEIWGQSRAKSYVLEKAAMVKRDDVFAGQ